MKALIVVVVLLVVFAAIACGVAYACDFFCPAVNNRMVLSYDNDQNEGLFSRVTNWVGCGLYSEKHGAAALILRSPDPDRRYTSDRADLCERLLMTRCHELKPGGLNFTNKTVLKRTMGNYLWANPIQNLANRGLPRKPAKKWADMQSAFLCYGKFNAFYLDLAARFWASNFEENARVLGIHWRGTDTATRWPFVSHDQSRFIALAQKELARGVYSAVFVASDEQQFVEACAGAFSTRVVAQEMQRAQGVALHMAQERDPEANAKSVIVDALTLSKCAHLVKGRSCVSDYSFFCNPAMSCDIVLSDKEQYHKNQGVEQTFELCANEKK